MNKENGSHSTKQAKVTKLHIVAKSAERSIMTYINEREKVAKIDSKIYSRGEGSDSPEGFRFKRTGKIN